MTKYAEHTKVPIEQSRAEIEKTVRRYGADQFLCFTSAERIVIGFSMDNRQVRFDLKPPVEGDYRRQDSYQKARRQQWRALLLVIKAKLESVASGIVTFEDEFLAHIVLPDGKLVGESIKPQIALAYDTGQVQALLPDLRNGGSVDG